MKNHNRKRRFVAKVESMEERFLPSTVPQFSVKDLGIVGNQYISGINSSGQMAFKQVVNNRWNSYVSGPNTEPPFTNIGNLGGGWSEATAINDFGQATGISGTSNGNMHGFFYSNGATIDIGAFPNFYSGDNGLHFTTSISGWSRPEAINNLGHIAGRSTTSVIYNPQTLTSENTMHAFIWDGTMHDIGALGGNYASAVGINNSDMVAGVSTEPSGTFHAFYYDGSIHDIGVLGIYTRPDGTTYDGSEANGINNLGQIVGQSSVNNSNVYGGNDMVHAFIYDTNNGSLKDLGTPFGTAESSATAINDLGQIVGSISTGTDIYGFLYSSDNGFIDLRTLVPKDSGFTRILPTKINNNGQIFAEILNSSGEEHQVLLTPKQNPVITWSNPADIVYGTPLSATQLNATASVPGTFTYSIAAGTVLHAGASQTLTATFTPDDTTDYTTATATASINVLKAPLTVTANNASVHYGLLIPPLTGTITGLVNGDTDVATYTTTAVQGSWAGYYPIVPHLTDPNYNITFVNGTLTISW